MTETDVVRRLEVAMTKAGSLRRWSQQHGIDPGMVSRVRRRLLPVPPVVLAALGMEKVVTYRRITGPKSLEL